ncbi:MAG: hypothetical protein J6O49_02095, partial [Bacteroidaceae bacterium]|nr:hypothetical protein [Bacteroidaceae bacterium]
YLPCRLVDINSYENLLSFERNFVPLHLGTVLIVNVYCLLGSYKNTIQLLTYQLFAQKTMKNTGGMPRGRGLAAPESGVSLVLLYR